MNSRGREDLESREPEKTPLIDMVFLLLIFFFVNLAIRSERVESQTSFLPADVRAELPKVPAPTALSDTAVILVEVLDLQARSTSKRLWTLWEKVSRCASKCGSAQMPSLRGNRFFVTTTSLDRLESMAAGLGMECDCKQVAEIVNRFPVPLRSPDLKVKLEQWVNDRLRLLPSDASVKLHVRMPNTTPVTFLRDLYELADSQSRIRPKYIYIRSLEEKV